MLRHPTAYLICILLLMLVHSAQSHASGDLMLTGPGSESVPALLTRYRVDIHGRIAVVQLEQVFLNDSPDWQDAVYRYPLPEGAAVYQMRVDAGETRLEGRVVEKQEATQQYHQARAAGKQAALTVQERPNLFRQHISALPPGQQVHVHLAFQTRVDFHTGQFSFDLPLTYTPRYAFESTSDTYSLTPPQVFANPEDQPERTLEIEIHLPGWSAIHELYSPSHPLTEDLSQGRGLVRVEGGAGAMQRDFRLEWFSNPSESPELEVSHESTDLGQYWHLTLVPPLRPRESAGLPRNLTWVLDVSGSMQGESLQNAIRAVSRGIENLTTEDHFNIITFNQSARKLFAQSVPATDEWKQVGLRRIAQLRAEGGTEILSAVRLLQGSETSPTESQVSQAILLTDGAVGNEIAVLQQVASVAPHIRWFTLGVGPAPNRYFLESLSSAGRGQAVFVDRPEVIAEAMAGLDLKLSGTQLTDLSLNLTGSGGESLPVQMVPARLPDLYPDDTLAISLFLPHQAGRPTPEQWSLTVQGQQYAEAPLQSMPSGKPGLPWQQTVTRIDARMLPSGTIARAWGRAAIADALRKRWQGASESEVREKVLPLALRHQLLSPYTAFLAAAVEPVTAPGLRPQQQLANTLPANLSNRTVSLPQTALNWQQQAGLGTLMILLGALLSMQNLLSRRRHSVSTRLKQAGYDL